jgi:hypothetical protein
MESMRMRDGLFVLDRFDEIDFDLLPRMKLSFGSLSVSLLVNVLSRKYNSAIRSQTGINA